MKLFAVLHNSSRGVFWHNLSSISLKAWDIYEKLLLLLKEELLSERSPAHSILGARLLTKMVYATAPVGDGAENSWQ